MAQETLPPSLAGLPSDALQQVFGSAEYKAGVRLASCSKPLLAEAKRCRLFRAHVLDQGARTDALQLVFALAEPKASVRLASCSRPLRFEAKRCQALWNNVLWMYPYNWRVLAAA